jgi:hypothetical protein
MTNMSGLSVILGGAFGSIHAKGLFSAWDHPAKA